MSIWLEVGLAIFAALVIFGIYAFLQEQFVTPLAPHRRFSYKLKSLLTDAERAFYETLVRAVGAKFLIVPQAHLDSFITAEDVGVEKFAATSHLEKRSVDFLLCDQKTLKPLCAVDLDPKLDESVTELCRTLKLPLLRLSSRSISAEDLAQKIIAAQSATS